MADPVITTRHTEVLPSGAAAGEIDRVPAGDLVRLNDASSCR